VKRRLRTEAAYLPHALHHAIQRVASLEQKMAQLVPHDESHPESSIAGQKGVFRTYR
jgi:hypothetical protein